MIVSVIDNGSLAPAAHHVLREVAAALSTATGITVHALSWKHSARIRPELLDGRPARTLASFVRTAFERGERDFVFVPFFISPQGAIGSALRHDLAALQEELGGFHITFTAGLADRSAIPAIAADRIRAVIRATPASFSAPPPVIVVDHGGPSAVSAGLRDELAAATRAMLGSEIGPLAAASMEGDHGPLLVDQLRAPGYAGHDVIVTPLFLSPGRHAGPDGDLARICREVAGSTRCHLADLIGTHPRAAAALASALRDALSTVHALPFA